ncbi:MAG TPA: zf-HC2 domain-containing protein [Candidatus Eisenbacteria bacterium]|nr:zf-HC2 domain-containing protein [Candidatus Eisenbacteria bacterium]
MIHLTLNQISAYIDAELPEASVELVRLHLSSCLECTERFGHIEEQEGALARLLVNDPGDPFFERFAERVLGPEPVEKAKPVKKPEPVKEAGPVPKAEPVKKPEPPLLVAAAEAPRDPTEPPRPRAAPAPAPKEAPRQRPAPKAAASRPKASGPVTNDGPRKAGAARILLTVAALLIVLSAAAVIAVRPRIPQLSFAPTERQVPDPGAQDARPPRVPSAPSDAVPDPSAGGSDLLERAAARSSEAERAGTAEAHDAAAAAWEEALPQLEKNADELAAGRREIASARYAAWSKDPTPERRDAAMSAVRAYLLCSPAGADRDRAWTWLAELKR